MIHDNTKMDGADSKIGGEKCDVRSSDTQYPQKASAAKIALKCVSCGKILRGDDTVYRVLSFDILNGRMTTPFVPTCSVQCAAAEKARAEDLLSEYLKEVHTTSIQKMSANDYFS